MVRGSSIQAPRHGLGERRLHRLRVRKPMSTLALVQVGDLGIATDVKRTTLSGPPTRKGSAALCSGGTIIGFQDPDMVSKREIPGVTATCISRFAPTSGRVLIGNPIVIEVPRISGPSPVRLRDA